MENERTRVCPVELAHSLDNNIRRWLQNPRKILAPYVKEGMSVLDIGCGPGYFSIEMADMVGKNGKIISADLQEGMLQKLHEKVQGTGLEKRIQLVRCDQNNVHVTEHVDFILAFYMVHEVPDKSSFFQQLRKILKDQGQLLMIEPKLFHVSREEFTETIRLAEQHGFKCSPGPALAFSWSALLRGK
jgi:ubiquinone/menaquinone biosynthesis C-methylase UbiE